MFLNSYNIICVIFSGTIYPGLMITSTVIYNILHFINVTLEIRNICVFLAPLFSSFTTIITFLLTKELKDTRSGLIAAAMISIVPGYISRSVAGSYDNEGKIIVYLQFLYGFFFLGGFWSLILYHRTNSSIWFLFLYD